MPEETANGSFKLSRNYTVGDILMALVIIGSILSSVFYVYSSNNKQFADQNDRFVAQAKDIAINANRLAWVEQGAKDTVARQDKAAQETKDRLDELLKEVQALSIQFARGFNAPPNPTR